MTPNTNDVRLTVERAPDRPMGRVRIVTTETPVPPTPSDEQYQAHILQGVSRTFALTIPELPNGLANPVSNAYLLCRIADTIEDEPSLAIDQKQKFHALFIDVVSGRESPVPFADELFPLLSERSLSAERDLIRNTDRVIRITRSFNSAQRAALERCVAIMCDGMERFERNSSLRGLTTLDELNSYCYHVAGVVGEMLTELFCDYSPEIAKNRDALLALAVSFGQGLQMTNILKDHWDDRGRGVCWLPQEVFSGGAVDLSTLTTDVRPDAYAEGLEVLVGIAHGHLENALKYALLIPPHETGIRKFCLWAIGLALLTLRKIHRRLDFTTGAQVKVSRNTVKAVVGTTRLTVRSDILLSALFNLCAWRLPKCAVGALPSRWSGAD